VAIGGGEQGQNPSAEINDGEQWRRAGIFVSVTGSATRGEADGRSANNRPARDQSGWGPGPHPLNPTSPGRVEGMLSGKSDTCTIHRMTRRDPPVRNSL
jgi:hypothetical protein